MHNGDLYRQDFAGIWEKNATSYREFDTYTFATGEKPGKKPGFGASKHGMQFAHSMLTTQIHQSSRQGAMEANRA
jgi:hypothetical protein